jgi:protein TonB
MPRPDLSLLPHDDAAHRGPQQAAPRQANGQADEVNQFFQKLNAALSAAALYPQAARSMKLSRKVRIAVHYCDGKAWGPQILQSSGFPVLDQAFLDRLARAAWPPPPPGFEGRELILPTVGSFW